MSDLLLEEILNNVPQKLLVGIKQQHEWVYKESHESCKNDQSLDSASSEWLFPYKRRAIYDTTLYKIALDCGCMATKESNATKNFEYTLVKAGNILLAQSHVHGSIANLRPSKFRKQHSSINELASQLQMQFSDKIKPLKPSNIFAIILHNTHYKDSSKPGFIKIAIPDPDNKSYINHYNVSELISKYPAPPTAEERDFKNLVAWKKQMFIQRG